MKEQRCRRYIGKVTVWAVFLCFLVNVVFVLRTQAKEDKRVLFLCSYSENFESVPEQINGVRSVFEGQDVTLDLEYMDMKRFDTQENLDNFYNLISYKLKNVLPYDAVLAADDKALQFVMDYQEELFQGIPIVFLCINDMERAETAVSSGYITGVTEIGNSLNQTIAIAKTFYPKATKVIAIVDDTDTGAGDKKQFYLERENFLDMEFGDVNVSEYTFDEFAQVLEDFDEHTILVYMCMFRDKNHQYMDMDDGIKFVAEHTHIPVFRQSIGGVGEGLLGGKMVSFFDSGVIAAEMVMEILAGKPVSEIEMVRVSPDRYYFDARLLKQYEIDPALIPLDAILINQEVSFYESNKKIILSVIVIMGVATLFLILLSIDNIRRRAVEKQLKQLNSELHSTYEDLAATEEELRKQFETIQRQVDEISLLNQKYEHSIKNIEGAVWEFDIEQDRIHFSEDIRNISDKITIKEGSIHQVLSCIFEDSVLYEFQREIKQYLADIVEEVNIKLPLRESEGKNRRILFKGRGVSDTKGNTCMIHGILLDVVKTKEEKYIEYLAEHDYLTKLPNRFYFMRMLEKTLAEGGIGAVCLLDLDNFKSINDTLGHSYGDKILIAVAERLLALSDECLFVARHGGDEFIILISDIKQEYAVYGYANKISEVFQEVFTVDGRDNYIGYSMGITVFPTDSKDMEQLIMNADTAMYKVKKEGKNNYLFYFDELNRELLNKIELEGILRKTVKEKNFMLLYQPQVNTVTNQIVSFEALLRVKDVQVPIISFIELAEELGMIIEIGRWVTEEAIRQVAEWENKGFSPKKVAVNFSTAQMWDVRYVEFLRNKLEEYHVEPQYIEIEITESILLEKADETLEFLEELKSVGVKLALDDFGTGYSSLSYLTYIPVDKIKLDKSLNDKFLSMKDVQFVKSLIALVHGLDMEVTAEGIEEKSQYEKLRQIECDTIQGYLFSKPISPQEVELIYDKVYEL